MDVGWVEGIGRYDGRAYVVDNKAGKVILFAYGARIGHGTSSRRIGRTAEGKLFVPAKRVGDVELPELVLVAHMRGYWQVGDGRDVLFAPTLPEGAELIGPPPPELEPGMVLVYQSHQPLTEEEPAESAAVTEATTDTRTDAEVVEYLTGRVGGWLRCDATEPRVDGDLGGGKTVLAYWTETADGARRYSAPDPNALKRSFERELAELLQARPKLRDRLRAVANRDPAATLLLVPLIVGAVRDCIYLSDAADRWFWKVDGAPQEVCGYRKGDEGVDLRTMIVSGQAVPLAHNTVAGEPVEMLGFPVRGGVAFGGRDGDPFKLVVPAAVGESRTIHALVRHEEGATVYGFTVANRADKTAMAAAASEGYADPLMAPYRRAVSFSGSRALVYFVLPDNRVLSIPVAK